MQKDEKEKEKKNIRSYRLDSTTIESIETYSNLEGCSNTKAVQELIGLGITIYLQKLYSEPEED